MTGKPATAPLCAAASMPLLTAGTYSLGTRPPATRFSKTKPVPGPPGSNRIFTRANWPAPPVCFLCL